MTVSATVNRSQMYILLFRFCYTQEKAKPQSADAGMTGQEPEAQDGLSPRS